MSFLVLHADAVATALAEDPVIPAAEVRALNGAIALFAEAGQIRGAAEAQALEAREAARVAGYEAGREVGLEQGQAEIRAELFRLAMREGEETRRRRAEIATIALEVVRRIAGEIGDAAFVAGLAERATAALVPDTVATVRVAPAQAEAVAERLSGRAGLTVEGDPALDGADCVVETALGRTHAGIETQLAQIEAAWSAVGSEAAR